MLNPISSMPNDGTFVLVTDGISWINANKFAGFKPGKWNLIDGICRGEVLNFNPTHWMPIPK